MIAKPEEMKGRKWRHHINPELYLKGFVEEGSKHKIWVYRKGMAYSPGIKSHKNNPWQTSTSTAGAEGGYYADTDWEGNIDPDTYEDLLMEREQEADDVLLKLRSQQELEKDEESVFTDYLAQMMVRGPRARERVTKVVPELVETFNEDQELLERLAGPDNPEKRARLRSALQRIQEKLDLGKRTHLRTLSAKFARAMAIVEAMKWTFYVAPKGQAFLTCDNPVFYFTSLGLLKPSSELSFPISSEVVFVASWRNDMPTGFVRATGENVIRLNRRSAAFATNDVFFSRAEPWVVNLLRKQHPAHGLRL